MIPGLPLRVVLPLLLTVGLEAGTPPAPPQKKTFGPDTAVSGRVVDDNGNGLGGVTVYYQLNQLKAPSAPRTADDWFMTYGHLVTGADGSFSLAARPHSEADIMLVKDRYYCWPWDDMSLYYASGDNEEELEEPSRSPVFHMHDLAKRVHHSVTGNGADLHTDGSPKCMDTTTAESSPEGDLEVSVQRTAELTKEGAAPRISWIFTLRLSSDFGDLPEGCGFLPGKGDRSGKPSATCTFTLPDKDAPAGSECSRTVNYYKDQTRGSIGISFHASRKGLLPPDLQITSTRDVPVYRDGEMKRHFDPGRDAREIAEKEQRMAALTAAVASGSIQGMSMADFRKAYWNEDAYSREAHVMQIATQLREGFYLWTVEADEKTDLITAIHGGLIVPED